LGNLSGLTLINHQIAIISTKQILKSDMSGPQNGHLLMMRYLDENQIQMLSELSELNLRLEPATPEMLAEFYLGQNSEMETVIVRPLNSSIIRGYGLIKDVYGKPAFLVTMDIEREIYRQGLVTRSYMIFTLLAAAITFSVILFLSLDLFFVKKLIVLNREKDLATKDETSQARIRLPGDDELSDLAAKIDKNICLLRQSIAEKKDIIEKQKLTEEELKKNTENLRAQTESMEKLNSLSIGRELKMVEMKKRIEEIENVNKANKANGDGQK
jgi:adenylate cyclase